MKKMFLFIFIATIFCFANISNVFGKECTCAYTVKESQTILFWELTNEYTLKVKLDKEKQKFSMDEFLNNKKVYTYDFEIEEYDIVFENCPSKLIAVPIDSYETVVTTKQWVENKYYLFLFTEEGKIKIFQENDAGNSIKEMLGLPSGEYRIEEKKIDYVDLDVEKTTCEESQDMDLACPEKYTDKLNQLETLKCYSSGASCSNDEIMEYKKVREELYTFCGNYISSAVVDYSPCLNFCINIKQNISKFENVSADSPCGISSKLVIWILNIIKWAKYIIPVIVILMGILDFMRAVASDKDDAMKKAQGRFVKRLIAAALIFIVPFIIEFILEKMGFGIDGCRVSDWWS